MSPLVSRTMLKCTKGGKDRKMEDRKMNTGIKTVSHFPAIHFPVLFVVFRVFRVFRGSLASPKNFQLFYGRPRGRASGRRFDGQLGSPSEAQFAHAPRSKQGNHKNDDI